MMAMSAYHSGELAVQARAGTTERARMAERGFRDAMPEQHRTFFGQLPFVVVACVDGQGQPWASILAGPPGFMATPTPQRLDVAILPPPGDPLAGTLALGRPIGFLGIQQHTRRRNRLNGTVVALGEEGFSVTVGQSFGNCPKYIQAREATFVPGLRQRGSIVTMASLDSAARQVIGNADTLFIATAHPDGSGRWPAHGADASHRGGRPGFVRVDADGRLILPDFSGNGFFNTFGNLQLEPRACLLFVDFATGSLLQVAGQAQVIWNGEDLQGFGGAERLLQLTPRLIIRHESALDLVWGAAEEAPQLALTGSWQS